MPVTVGRASVHELPAGTRAHVRVPATSANLGPGFDALGLALGLHDEVEVMVSDRPGVRVRVHGEGSGTVPDNERHLVAATCTQALQRAGAGAVGLEMLCRNTIPHGRGLGSSAAAAVAGALAARELLRGGSLNGGALGADGVLALVTAAEGHPDNAAAALLGGLTIAWCEDSGPRAVSLSPHPALRPVVLVPPQPLSTAMARGILPTHVPHRDAAANAGRAALLVEALTRTPALLMAATRDWLHQSQRAAAMPATAALVAALRSEGHAAVVSGAGPTVLVLGTDDDAQVPEVAGWSRLALAVDIEGARVL